MMMPESSDVFVLGNRKWKSGDTNERSDNDNQKGGEKKTKQSSKAFKFPKGLGRVKVHALCLSRPRVGRMPTDMNRIRARLFPRYICWKKLRRAAPPRTSVEGEANWECGLSSPHQPPPPSLPSAPLQLSVGLKHKLRNALKRVFDTEDLTELTKRKCRDKLAKTFGEELVTAHRDFIHSTITELVLDSAQEDEHSDCRISLHSVDNQASSDRLSSDSPDSTVGYLSSDSMDEQDSDDEDPEWTPGCESACVLLPRLNAVNPLLPPLSQPDMGSRRLYFF